MSVRAILTVAVVLVGPILVEAVPAATLAPSTPPALRVGDSAVYHVTLHDPHLLAEVELNVEEGAVSCGDGFERESTCARIGVRYSIPSFGVKNATAPLFVSLAHAEAIQWGTWNLGEGPQQQYFATPSPFWPGHAYFSQSGSRPDAWNAFRPVVVGLGMTLRMPDLDDSTTHATFGGATGAVVVAANGTDAVAHLVLPAAPGTALSAVAYTYHFEASHALPTAFAVHRVADGHIVANGTRASSTVGSDAVSHPAWMPLDFPTTAPGTRLAAWTDSPPTEGGELFLPLNEATLLPSLSPTGMDYAAANPDHYLARASYVEQVIPLDGEALGVPVRRGSWFFLEGTPDLDFRGVFARRLAPDFLHAARVDDFSEDGSSRFTDPTFVPPRETLPDALIIAEDAYRRGAASAPLHEDGFGFVWTVPAVSGVQHTPDAAWWVTSCGVPGQPWPFMITFISAVNGQILSRLTSGASDCEPGPQATPLIPWPLPDARLPFT